MTNVNLSPEIDNQAMTNAFHDAEFIAETAYTNAEICNIASSR